MDQCVQRYEFLKILAKSFPDFVFTKGEELALSTYEYIFNAPNIERK